MTRSKRGVRTPTVMLIAAIVISASLVLVTRFNGLEVISSIVRPRSIPLHEVTFNETGSGCGGYGGEPAFRIDYVPSWYATLGNLTIVQPPNATLPLPSPEGQNSPDFATISKITFKVPDGSYPYHVSLGQDGTYNGKVVVNGSDVVVQIVGPLCA